MAVQLENVVPFGRSLDEYRRIFQLTPDDEQRTILDIAGGPASFNAEMHQLGHRVTSIDPIYVFSGAEIEQRFNACVDDIIQQVKNTPNDWNWTYHQSPDRLRQNREAALRRFLADYDLGKQENRYIPGSILELPETPTYDLILCSHFLFLYSAQLDGEFHQQAITALLQRGREVRIFPLLTLMLERSPQLDPIRAQVKQLGFHSEIIPVEYELQRGGNQMLRIHRD